MAKPSGIKITDAIDRLARWFAKEIGQHVPVAYMTDGKNYTWGTEHKEQPLMFSSFTALRRWMESEVKRRRILFRRF